MKFFVLLFFILPSYCFSQYEEIYHLALPEQFATMEKSVLIYSTPNPNYAEFEVDKRASIVWKHSTIIKAAETITIKETGAYLLRNGVWWKRASFNPKKQRNCLILKI